MELLTLEEGTFLVRLARKAVKCVFTGEDISEFDIPRKLEEKRGVFVTINTYPGHLLRGCIGFPFPVMPLFKAVVEAAKAAAFEDPRFVPLNQDELKRVVFEVSVLTVPEEIKEIGEKIMEQFEIGKHGLIVEYGPFSGLLLPQVPVEHGWNKKDFLEHLCLKAGLSRDCWLWEGVKISKFQAQIFREKRPGGEVEEVFL